MTPPDAVTVQARKTLLDVLGALGDHRGAVVLVGAQAVHLRTNPDVVPTAPFTRDADLCIDPEQLGPLPPLQEILLGLNFRRGAVGTWTRGERSMTSEPEEVDLMVPEPVAPGTGRRAVDLDGEHDRLATRRTRGLAACLLQCSSLVVPSLTAEDPRQFEIAVAETAPLLVAKLHKLNDRKGSKDRWRDKDAVDILRILRFEEHLRLRGAGDLPDRLRKLLAAPSAASEVRDALLYLGALFGSRDGEGTQAAVRALRTYEAEEATAQSCSALASALLDRAT